MSLEEFRKADPTAIPIGKLISIIARGHNIYLNHNLKDLDITATQMHLLYEISNQDNINQENIALRCNINKGAVARSIRKLEEKGLVEREIDTENRRQNKVSLTEKGRKTLYQSSKIFNNWELEVFSDNEAEKQALQKTLKEIAIRTIELNLGEKQ